MNKFSQKIAIITQATIKVPSKLKLGQMTSKQKPFSTKYVQDD